MLTPQEVENFAQWIINQENKMMDMKHPVAEGTENMTDDELLDELGINLITNHSSK